MYSVLIRDDLDRHQKVTSMLNSIRLYLGAEFGVLSRLGESVEYEPGCVSPGNSNVGDRLSPEFFRQAIQSRQIVTRENVDNWRAYVACPVFIGGELAYVLEFGSTDRRGAEIVDEKEFHISDLTLNILGVVGQWIGAEYRLLEQEKRSLDRATEVRQRLGVISPRERQVLSLLSRGESSKTMARMLDISPKTVEMHRANLLRKTNAKSSTELVQLAVISGIFERTQ
jgi:DNA-binding CsgD family transcriptional regulator